MARSRDGCFCGRAEGTVRKRTLAMYDLTNQKNVTVMEQARQIRSMLKIAKPASSISNLDNRVQGYRQDNSEDPALVKTVGRVRG
jgi:hypothetical protein